jgi:phosphatidate cytidylyltransferase
MYFWLVLGLGIGLMGQLGDLFESSLKRDAGVKDASDIIPGHGGLLDRFDSYLFASMFTYLSIAICVSIPFLSELFTK